MTWAHYCPRSLTPDAGWFTRIRLKKGRLPFAALAEVAAGEYNQDYRRCQQNNDEGNHQPEPG